MHKPGTTTARAHDRATGKPRDRARLHKWRARARRRRRCASLLAYRLTCGRYAADSDGEDVACSDGEAEDPITIEPEEEEAPLAEGEMKFGDLPELSEIPDDQASMYDKCASQKVATTALMRMRVFFLY